MTSQRPPRTEGHRQRDMLIQHFAAAGLTPVLSTNGSNHDADIEVIVGPQYGEVREAWMKPKGQTRLAEAHRG